MKINSVNILVLRFIEWILQHCYCFVTVVRRRIVGAIEHAERMRIAQWSSWCDTMGWNEEQENKEEGSNWKKIHWSIDRRQLHWRGHLLRIIYTRIAREIWDTRVNNKGIGKPKKTPNDYTAALIKNRNSEWNSAVIAEARRFEKNCEDREPNSTQKSTCNGNRFGLDILRKLYFVSLYPKDFIKLLVPVGMRYELFLQTFWYG